MLASHDCVATPIEQVAASGSAAASSGSPSGTASVGSGLGCGRHEWYSPTGQFRKWRNVYLYGRRLSIVMEIRRIRAGASPATVPVRRAVVIAPARPHRAAGFPSASASQLRTPATLRRRFEIPLIDGSAAAFRSG